VAPETRVEGPQSLGRLVDLLEGYEAPAAAWEGEILPARIQDYDPLWLDALCLSGRLVWARTRLAADAAAAILPSSQAAANGRPSAAVTAAMPRRRPGRSTPRESDSPERVAAEERGGRGVGPV